ncbi:MAG: hypothetical protein J1E16_04560 [Muribaculaceae bacterium]|nr:hypothetical protein [Muribaculaceae bacterium]
MKKLILASALMAVAFGGLNAQVVNRAIQVSPEGAVDCGAMPDLDNLRSFSLQFWFNPDSWTEGATIMSRGDNFAIKLGPQGTVRFINGEKEIAASQSELKPGEWSQVTMICDDGKASVIVNNEETSVGTLGEIGKSGESFVLGGNYSGKIDEVRIWNESLDDTMKSFDYFTHNTLNKWCPMWDNLVAYYKMDQKDCPYLVDYKGIEDNLKSYDNHGILSPGVEKVDADNDKMPYLINSAYTNNERFFDRIIPREQYLLSNDLIILGVNVYEEDGRLETKSPNNHAVVLKNTEYLPEFEGREGVLSFDGNASMELPAKMFPIEDVYTFESWVYIDEWVPGAYILRKENADQTKGIAAYLGDEDEKRVLVRINGKTYASTLDVSLPVKKWVHFGFCPGTNSSLANTFFFFKDGRRYNCDADSELTTGEIGKVNTFINDDSAEFPLILGENLKGKLDETLLWNKDLSASVVSGHKTKVPMPGLDNTISQNDIQGSLGFYRYDDPEDLGFSSHSQDSWLKIMKSAYEGHGGVKFFISVQGSYSPSDAFGDWRNILGSADKRARFASDLAEISKNYDGVELDLEWIEKVAQWSDYGLLAKEIREKLPEGKEFRISLHNSYTGFPAEYMEYVDGFTFQQYGPQAANFGYQNFQNNVNNFMKKFDRNKIMTSYSTTTSKGDGGSAVIGVKGDCLESYMPSDADADKYTNGKGETWTYMGPMQVYKRAKYTRENNLQGIFYWDMGNDYWLGTAAKPEMPEYNQAKYCSYAINANNDTIVKDLKVNHYYVAGVSSIQDDVPGPVEYYNLQGVKVSHPEKGIYIRREGNKTKKVIF